MSPWSHSVCFRIIKFLFSIAILSQTVMRSSKTLISFERSGFSFEWRFDEKQKRICLNKQCYCNHPMNVCQIWTDQWEHRMTGPSNVKPNDVRCTFNICNICDELHKKVRWNVKIDSSIARTKRNKYSKHPNHVELQ